MRAVYGGGRHAALQAGTHTPVEAGYRHPRSTIVSLTKDLQNVPASEAWQPQLSSGVIKVRFSAVYFFGAMLAAPADREEAQLLRLFASYSPAEVVLRYSDSANPKVPQAPEQQDFDAAIGFVDVSGFTALSEKLNKDHGRKGAELLNQCASPLA